MKCRTLAKHSLLMHGIKNKVRQLCLKLTRKTCRLFTVCLSGMVNIYIPSASVGIKASCMLLRHLLATCIIACVDI